MSIVILVLILVRRSSAAILVASRRRQHICLRPTELKLIRIRACDSGMCGPAAKGNSTQPFFSHNSARWAQGEEDWGQISTFDICFQGSRLTTASPDVEHASRYWVGWGLFSDESRAFAPTRVDRI